MWVRKQDKYYINLSKISMRQNHLKTTKIRMRANTTKAPDITTVNPRKQNFLSCGSQYILYNGVSTQMTRAFPQNR